jgi:hypothetical protein
MVLSRIAGLVAGGLLLAGCAELQVFDARGEQTGIKFYVSKPYLLVAFTSNSDKPVEVTVEHLPDVANPYYARPKAGFFGNSNLQMNFSEGKLTSFGQQVDSGAAGALDAIGGYQKTLADISRARMEARAKGEPLPNFRLYEIVADGSAIKLREVPIDTAPPATRR